jgi:hypothetical protein
VNNSSQNLEEKAYRQIIVESAIKLNRDLADAEGFAAQFLLCPKISGIIPLNSIMDVATIGSLAKIPSRNIPGDLHKRSAEPDSESAKSHVFTKQRGKAHVIALGSASTHADHEIVCDLPCL